MVPPSRRLMFDKHWTFTGLNCPAQFRHIADVPCVMLHPKIKELPQIDRPDTLHLGFAIQILSGTIPEPFDALRTRNPQVVEGQLHGLSIVIALTRQPATIDIGKGGVLLIEQQANPPGISFDVDITEMQDILPNRKHLRRWFPGELLLRQSAN